MHKSKNIVHINTKAKRSQTSYLQEVWPFYSLTSVKDGYITTYLYFATTLCLNDNKLYSIMQLSIANKLKIAFFVI